MQDYKHALFIKLGEPLLNILPNIYTHADNINKVKHWSGHRYSIDVLW